jgi:hypothetical protein
MDNHLHVPRSLRLAIEISQFEPRSLCMSYPLQSVESACGRSPRTWAYITWQTSADARRVKGAEGPDPLSNSMSLRAGNQYSPLFMSPDNLVVPPPNFRSLRAP